MRWLKLVDVRTLRNICKRCPFARCKLNDEGWRAHCRGINRAGSM